MSTTTITRTECEVRDVVVRWAEVVTGDLVLLGGELVPAEQVDIYQDTWNRVTGETFTRVDIYHLLDNGMRVMSIRHGDHYTAVRRYVEYPAGDGDA